MPLTDPDASGRCRVCLSSSPPTRLSVPEVMYGSGKEFRYDLCSDCGSLQIAVVPEDLSLSYPPDYYAHAAAEPRGVSGGLHRLAVTARNRVLLTAPAPAAAALLRVPWIGRVSGAYPLAPLRHVSLRRTWRVADVGGGNGGLLAALRDVGLRALTCVDPYTPWEGVRHGIRFLRLSLADVDESFDLVMYHHSLEHVPDLDAELRAARARLAPGGVLLLRLPLLPNAAFERYGRHWVQIDAPRHLHVPSRRGLVQACGRAGLAPFRTGDDGTAFQFWGSELASKGIPVAANAGGLRRQFGRRRLSEFRHEAGRLNREGRSDQGWLLLRATE